MKKYEKLNRKEWLELGAIVKMARLGVMEAELDIAGQIGKTHPIARKMYKAYKLLSQVQSDMDDLLSTDVCNRCDMDFWKEANYVFYGSLLPGQGEMCDRFVKCIRNGYTDLQKMP